MITNPTNTRIVCNFELYFMGDEKTRPQAVKFKCSGLPETYEQFFANQTGYDAAIADACIQFGKHVDSYWPGSIGGFQVENGNLALLNIKYWQVWLKKHGFNIGFTDIIKLDEFGHYPELTDSDREANDLFEDAVEVMRNHHYHGGML